jgi:hypothetical protein
MSNKLGSTWKKAVKAWMLYGGTEGNLISTGGLRTEIQTRHPSSWANRYALTFRVCYITVNTLFSFVLQNVDYNSVQFVQYISLWFFFTCMGNWKSSLVQSKRKRKNNVKMIRLQALTAKSMKMAAFGVSRRVVWWPPWWPRQFASLKRRSISTRLHGATSRKTS